MSARKKSRIFEQIVAAEEEAEPEPVDDVRLDWEEAALPSPTRDYKIYMQFNPERSDLELKKVVYGYVQQLQRLGCGDNIKVFYRGRKPINPPFIQGYDSFHFVEIWVGLFPSAVQVLKLTFDADKDLLRYMIMKRLKMKKKEQEKYIEETAAQEASRFGGPRDDYSYVEGVSFDPAMNR
ncbi:unnamed protein product [Vitrella brassicaformis CCMP3155]|uniref:Ribosomal protein S6 n=2 Tax=Vitrella brassicaformis TaxID=1169539 RepID=A0A0G4EER6_VITBC|nr:unnamed protein product [Vitrella brassicaformis CCMP3155]|eukprot:CEL93863.1 unnamed protein product [Vitrella brassicaformis CCMP3155]